MLYSSVDHFRLVNVALLTRPPSLPPPLSLSSLLLPSSLSPSPFSSPLLTDFGLHFRRVCRL